MNFSNLNNYTMLKLTKNILAVAALLCAPALITAQCDYTFTHDAISPADTPLPIGSTFSEDGIVMTTTDFNHGSGPMYNLAIAKTVMPGDVFGTGQSMVLSNAAATYDVSAHSCANVITIEYFDGAGVENLEVNGAGLFIDEFEFMPTAIAPGVTMTVTEVSYSGGAYFLGTIKLEGAVSKITIGGQQFEVDDLHVTNSNASTTGCYGPCDLLFDFETLPLGDRWGDVVASPTDHPVPPGGIIYSTGSVDFYIDNLHSLSGFVGFNYIAADNSVAAYTGSGISLMTNNVTAGFDLSSIDVDTLCFDFVDMGGHEELTINGSTFLTPDGYGELMTAPATLGGVVVSVTGSSLGFGFVGSVVLVGDMTDLKIGGQEFWIDNVCIVTNDSDSGGAVGAASAVYCEVDCDYGVDNSSQVFGNQWGNVIPGPQSWQANPGDLIFNEGGIDVYIDELDNFLYTTTYSHIGIVHSPLASFGVDQVMNTNNATALFDLSAIATDSVCIEWLDLGGHEVLEINGDLVSSPDMYGQLLGLPTSIGGTAVQITGNPVITVVSGVATITGYQGKILIIGNVDSLRLGGQEFWIDNLCISEDTGAASACVGDLDSDGIVGVSDLLVLLGAFGIPCP